MSIQGSINQMIGTVGALTSLSKIAEQRMQRANTKAQAAQQAKKVQRRKFREYLAQMPTSFGGTVGDLPKNVQKTIAKKYSSNERKSIMDEMDQKRIKDGKK